MQKNQNKCGIYLFVFIALVIALSTSPLFAADLEDLIFIESAYENLAGYENDGKAGCTFFSGNVGDPLNGVVPQGADSEGKVIKLAQSSIGCPTPARVGWVSDTTSAADTLVAEAKVFIKKAEGMFDSYYSPSDGTQYDPNQIYMNYDFEMSSGNNTDGNAAILYEQAGSEAAKEALYRALRINESDEIIEKILDITYYQTTALIMQGNLCLEKAFNIRFQEFGKTGGDIENELKYLGWKSSDHSGFSESTDGAWYNFNKASKLWFELFSSPIQRDFLVEFSPQRSLSQTGNNSAFTGTTPPADWEGEWPPVVYDGYKDVAAMMRALSQRAKVVNEVAKRLVLLLERDKASALVEKYVQEFALEEGVIMSILFKDGAIPEKTADGTPASEAYPGLTESFLEYRNAVSELSHTRDLADNTNMNALGFDRDIVPILPGEVDQTNLGTTFDYKMSAIYSGEGNPKGVLKTSTTQDGLAKSTRINYNVKITDFLTQMDTISNQYDRELIAITGYTPEGEPNLENPAAGGGLLEQQITNLQLAENNIQRVIRQMENVNSRIEIEQNRVEQVNAELGARAELSISYGNKTAKFTEQIADIQAEMAFASGMTQAATTALSACSLDKVITGAGAGIGVSAAVQAANAVYQRNMQRKIGDKQAEMTRLNAQKEAEFIYSDTRINDINSQANIKTWYLELKTLEIDLMDAQIRLGQELDRLAQYYSDIESLVMRRDRSEKRVAQRHFADPTYRIEVLDAVLKAEEVFKRAQAEVYLTARSLDYKFPISPISNNQYDSILNGVLQSRTAAKLVEQMDVMQGFNDNNPGVYLGRQPFYWNFSLRKEYLGMINDIKLASGETLNAVDNFQKWLADLKNDPANLVDYDKNGTPDHLSIPFSTVKFASDNDIKTLNLRDSSGVSQSMPGKPIFDSRLWDDKIDLVHINIVGNNSYINTTTKLMPVVLLYGGTGFVRTKDSVTTEDGTIDFKTYPNINWTIDIRDGGFGWKQEEYRPQAMSAKVTGTYRDVPEDVITTKNFRELPVAATGWRLLVPLNGTNFDNIHDIEIIIIHKARTKPFSG